ncbi:hypothetical protein ABKN59_006779 [Abortiporus biennis]
MPVSKLSQVLKLLSEKTVFKCLRINEVNTPLVDIRRISVEQTIPLRHSILWPEKPVEYIRLPEDDSGHHYGAFLPSSSDPVAVISVFIEPLPHDSVNLAARFRKFACDPNHRNQGIGSALLQHVFLVASKDLQCSAVWCDGRLSTAGWYERRGMFRFGGNFFKGDIEYIRMMMPFVQTSQLRNSDLADIGVRVAFYVHSDITLFLLSLGD